MVESMKQVSENYLSTEKGYADDWAAYIASCHMTAEEALDYIDDDELVEITPKSIRMRKKILGTEARKKLEARKKN